MPARVITKGKTTKPLRIKTTEVALNKKLRTKLAACGAVG